MRVYREGGESLNFASPFLPGNSAGTFESMTDHALSHISTID